MSFLRSIKKALTRDVFFNHAVVSILCTFPIALFIVLDPFQLFVNFFLIIESYLPCILEIPTVEAMIKYGQLPKKFVVAYVLFVFPVPLIAFTCVLLWLSSRIMIPKLEQTSSDSEATRCFALVITSLGLFLATVYFLTGTQISQWLPEIVLTSGVVFSALLATVFVANMALQFYPFSYPYYLFSNKTK